MQHDKNLINYVILALITYILFPLIGLLLLLGVRRKIIRKGIPEPPTKTIFIIFATYGGLVQLVITSYCLEWSGMTSLGAFYLIFIAPIVMLVAAFVQFKLRHVSDYHKWAFWFSSSYLVIAPITIAILYFTVKN